MKTSTVAVLSLLSTSPALGSRSQPPFCKIIQPALQAVNRCTSATAFCSSWLHISPVTSTVTKTSTSTSVSTVLLTDSTSTVTAPPTILTSTDTSTTTTTQVSITTVYATTTTNTITASVETSTLTATTETVTATTCTSTSTPPDKRSLQTPKVPAPLSSLATPLISSACKCLNLPTPTSTTTSTTTTHITTVVTSKVTAKTTITPTQTSATTIFVTASTTITLTITSQTADSTTITATTTQTITATTTQTPVCSPASPSVTACATTSLNGGGFQYQQYFSGTGVTENPNNSGNDVPQFAPPQTAFIPGTTPACDAVQQCLNTAASQSVGPYFSVDIHYRISTAMWECVQYFDPNFNPNAAGDFNVQDADVSVAMGYSLG